MSTRRIAEMVGVSIATVSLALNDHPRIPDATRRRVRAAARRIGYKANTKVAELMGQIRSSRVPAVAACLGVISFYESQHPWKQSRHLARMYQGMERRATRLGYRLESFWLRGPRVTAQRLRAILDARGIEGLLCFGSPRIDEKFPREFDHYAIVTQGWSITTPLHRVINHGFNNTWRALEKIHELGYRRPGMITTRNMDVRSVHANLSAYFGWCEHTFGVPAPIPVLRVDGAEEKPILEWLRFHRPDVIIFLQDYEVLTDFSELLRRAGIRVPHDVGVVAISQILRGTSFSGLEENQLLMGEWAVEMLIGRITHRDIGIPRHPRVEMVESVWVDGQSLRRQMP